MLFRSALSFNRQKLEELDPNNDYVQTCELVSTKGCIIVHSDTMNEVLRTSNRPSQTDSTMGFVVEPTVEGANACITVSFCPLRNKYVMTQMAVLWGKSGNHYGQYFSHELRRYGYNDIGDFIDGYTGKVCDFCQGERLGFEIAISQVFSVNLDEYDNLDQVYCHCKIHFCRSRNRVARNSGVIPIGRKAEFIRMTNELLTIQTATELRDAFSSIKRTFARSRRWVNWFENPIVAKHIFPGARVSVWLPLSYSLCLTQLAHLFASKNQSFAGGDTADTQGCESWNRTLQDLFTETMPNKVASIANVVEFFIKYTRAEVQLFRSARAGMRVDHRLTPRRNNRTRRDSGSPTDTGRPPESSVDLLNTRRRRTGRPRGSRNVAPRGNQIILAENTLPYGFRFPQRQRELSDHRPVPVNNVVNTCHLDTGLQTFAWLLRFDQDISDNLRVLDPRFVECIQGITGGFVQEVRHERKTYCRQMYMILSEQRGLPCFHAPDTRENGLVDCHGAMMDFFQTLSPGKSQCLSSYLCQTNQ